MKTFYRDYLLKNWWFHILTAIAVVLMIASFALPPIGVIDNSVLLATSELFAFAALGTVIKAVDEGKKATIKKGSTTLTVGDVEQEQEREQNEVDA